MRSYCLIAAGGTGGHIYPALAIAKALKKLDSALEVEFVGTTRGLENEIVSKEGFKLHLIDIGRLNRNVSLSERIWTLITLPGALIKSAWLVFKLKPRFVLGVGGYVTGPVVLAAACLGRKSFIWEPNAQPGLANRLLAPFVTECLVVFEAARRRLRSRKFKIVGMPVREAIEKLHNQAHSQDLLVGPTRPLRVLVFGGSQGAQAINQVVCDTLCSGPNWLESTTWVHQTGPREFERFKGQYEKAGVRIDVRPYIYDMDVQYAEADLVVSRAGSGTLSELAAAGRPAILVPLPTAADNHQLRNAKVLSDRGAAVLMEQKDFTVHTFSLLIDDLRKNLEKRELLKKNIRAFFRPQADLDIARHLLEES